MQKELDATYPLLRIDLLGVNQRGQEAGLPTATVGRVLPWLQDVDANSDGRGDVANESWQVTDRDVVILDGSNVKVGVYNLTTYNLATPANYATLREMLVDAAMASQKPWKNATNPLDVNGNGHVAPIDVLLIVNVLNDTGTHELPPPVTAASPPPYYDCNGDGYVAPIDALQIINFLNAQSGGEGEGEGGATGAEDASCQWSVVSGPWGRDDATRDERSVPADTVVPLDRLFATDDLAWLTAEPVSRPAWQAVEDDDSEEPAATDPASPALLAALLADEALLAP